MDREPQIHLLLDLETEVVRWRRRTMFLLSVILHFVVVILLLVSPNLFRRGAEALGIQFEPRPQRETTFLFMPPDLMNRLKQPPRENSPLSDKDRRAQGKSPIINPRGIPMPYSRGNTPLPEIAGGAPPKLEVPPIPPALPPGAGSAESHPPPPPEENKEQAKLHLYDVPQRPAGGGKSPLQLSTTSPGDAIRQSLEAAARGRAAAGSGEGPGDSPLQFRNFDPSFSTEAPIILSDTMGVDFGPYLARVVFNVRRNWYSMIPVAAKLGQKGRVAIVFEILKDGSVPQLRLIAGSGSDPLDRAAVASIRASNPFPPLPTEFTGEHLVLQFTFLYNLGFEP
ncbi:MAG: TonB C-terminal domain-containing protein [Acidobacteria bacterium]|nr:TonB C-terminal domain-containing protein [Acidobacteriota bacterium]